MVSAVDYKRYIEKSDVLIRDMLDQLECQPIFFIGSGLSKRYIGTPSWIELLSSIATFIGLSSQEFSYIQQRFNRSPLEIADHLENLAFEWAWKGKPKIFPTEYFGDTVDRSIFLKRIACQIVLDTKNVTFLDKNRDELALFRSTNPHAIITTNYDDLIETIFDGYEPVVGDRVIKYNLNLVGEVFKIHGSVEEPSSIVINSKDYDQYRIRKKYISAKLLTYLTEHPVFIFGYGFGDSNVTEIIEDVGEIIGHNGFIENIFYVKWVDDVEPLTSLAEEYVVGNQESQYRVRAITTSDLSWIFRSISQERPMNPVNTKVLRSLAARTYNLIRSDIPRHKVEVDYNILESIVDKDEELSKLLGIVPSNNSNMTHPFTITQLGRQLGYPGWHGARRLIERVNRDKGINLLATDNQYHCSVKTGDKSKTSKYSKLMVGLLKKVQAEQDYDVQVDA